MKRTKREREQDLSKIANLEKMNPARAGNLNELVEFISVELGLSFSTAKKDISEVRRRRKEAGRIDQQYQVGLKLEELAFIKQTALESNNINAYLGAINTEIKILGLDRMAILTNDAYDAEEVNASLDRKKKEFLKKLCGYNNDNEQHNITTE